MISITVKITTAKTAEAAVQNAADELHMPPEIRTEFAGNARWLKDTTRTEPLLIAAALISIYIVLGVLYESLTQPLTIISTLPSAGLGALLSLWIFGYELSIMGVIGILLLMGIVKKNAIMMVDFALEAEREQDLSPAEAIYQACVVRFRPIMMTTLAAMFGAIPLAIGQGDGSEIRQPLGVAIIGGLVVSQLLTLFTTPIIYLYMDRFRARRHEPVPVPEPHFV